MDVNDYGLIVIKVGTNVLMDENSLNKAFLSELVSEINSLVIKGKKVVVVTSGAIGFGKKKICSQGKEIFEQQGLAAIGQPMLMLEYYSRFENYGLNAAQVLLSQHDLLNKECAKNIKNTFDFFFENKVIAIVNENDVVATQELRKNGVFSDNDTLAALLSEKINANLLVMLTAKNGIIGGDGKIIEELADFGSVKKISESSSGGRGGIETKLSAIKLATSSGCDVFVSGAENFGGFSLGKAKGTFVKTK